MIPYGRQDINQNDIDAVVEVLRSDWLTQGPIVPRFEQVVADYCGARYAVAVNSATSALHLACLALDLGPGDWLWTSPNSFVASANCALYCGAKVDFVDIDPRTYNLSVERLEQKLELAAFDGRLPKIVIPVHFAGQSCDMASIHALSKRYGFHIVEDASHAVGGSYRGERIGSGRYSDVTVFSFHPVKIITSGEGGIATTNNEELARRMRLFRSHGITDNPADMEPRPACELWNYQQVNLGFNYRMTDIQAALGVSQLRRLDDFVVRRRAIAKRYDDVLTSFPLSTPWQHPDSWSSYHLYVVRLKFDISNKSQQDIYREMHAQGVRVNLHYIPIYRHPHYARLAFVPGYCPDAEGYFAEALSLPIFPGLSDRDWDLVVSALRRSFSR
jgi:UDP-4-amino-4,6-dideoxy-N-acetyl-beta-L-altrosamine transaminase